MHYWWKSIVRIFVGYIKVSILTPINQANAKGNDERTFVPLKISSEKFVPLTDEELEEIRNNDEYTLEVTYDQAVERTSEITVIQLRI